MEHLQGKLTLKLGGRDRTLYFDYLFLSILLSEYGSEDKFQEVVDKNPIRLIPLLALYGLKAGEDENDLPENFTEVTVMKWLREVNAEDQRKVFELYRHSMGFISAIYEPMVKAASEAGAKSAKPKA